MLRSWWPRADARCLPIFCSTNPTLPLLPAGHHASPAFLSHVIFPKKLSQGHSSFSQYQNTLTNWAKHLPGVVSLITTTVTNLMTDLAVTIYDTGNAIISIKVVLVRFFSPFGSSFSEHLATPQQGTSWIPSKCLKRDTASNWHKTKAQETKQLVPKHGRHIWYCLESFHMKLSFCFFHPTDALLLALTSSSREKKRHFPLSPTKALVPRGYDNTNGCVLVLQQIFSGCCHCSLCQVIVRHEPGVCCGWSRFWDQWAHAQCDLDIPRDLPALEVQSTSAPQHLTPLCPRGSAFYL